MSLSQEKDGESGSRLQQIMDILENIPFFSGFPVQSLKLTSYLCETGDYEDGDTLVEAGDDPGLAMYVISGSVKLRPVREGKAAPGFSSGDFFGGLSLLGPLPSLFTITAVGKTQMLLLSRDQFSSVLEQFPELHDILHINLLKQLRSWEQAHIDAEGEDSPSELGVTLF